MDPNGQVGGRWQLMCDSKNLLWQMGWSAQHAAGPTGESPHPLENNSQVGGCLDEYEDFSFATVRRAGHEAPYTGG